MDRFLNIVSTFFTSITPKNLDNQISENHKGLKRDFKFSCCCLFCIKRDSPTRFWTSSFFHHSNQPRLLTNGFKYFRILFRFRRNIHILVSKKQYQTARSQKKFNPGTLCDTWRFFLYSSMRF